MYLVCPVRMGPWSCMRPLRALPEIMLVPSQSYLLVKSCPTVSVPFTQRVWLQMQLKYFLGKLQNIAHEKKQFPVFLLPWLLCFCPLKIIQNWPADTSLLENLSAFLSGERLGYENLNAEVRGTHAQLRQSPEQMEWFNVKDPVFQNQVFLLTCILREMLDFCRVPIQPSDFLSQCNRSKRIKMRPTYVHHFQSPKMKIFKLFPVRSTYNRVYPSVRRRVTADDLL